MKDEIFLRPEGTFAALIDETNVEVVKLTNTVAVRAKLKNDQGFIYFAHPIPITKFQDQLRTVNVPCTSLRYAGELRAMLELVGEKGIPLAFERIHKKGPNGSVYEHIQIL